MITQKTAEMICKKSTGETQKKKKKKKKGNSHKTRKTNLKNFHLGANDGGISERYYTKHTTGSCKENPEYSTAATLLDLCLLFF